MMITNGRVENLQLLDDFLELGDENSDLYKEVFRHTLSRTCHYQDSEDIMSQVKINLLEKRHLYNPNRPLRPWIFSVADHALIDHQRKNWRWTRRAAFDYDTTLDPELNDDEFLDSDPEDSCKGALDEIVDNEKIKRVRECVDRLPYNLREVIGLVYFHGLKYREAADILQIPVGTVKSRLYSGIVKIRELMSIDTYAPAA